MIVFANSPLLPYDHDAISILTSTRGGRGGKGSKRASYFPFCRIGRSKYGKEDGKEEEETFEVNLCKFRISDGNFSLRF